MRLNLTDASIAILMKRTEGWISGLQLAALSLQTEQDVSGFLEGFAGDDRNIRSYLVEEVLAGQPAEIRQFLLVTSILERLTAPLCAALMEEIGAKHGPNEIAGLMSSQEILEHLEQRNLFIVPLDKHREWYRYHTLFAELLRFHLWSEQRDHLPALHRRAAAWLEQHGFIEEAIRQAVALGDAALAGAIRLRSGRVGVNGQIGLWLKRFKQLSLMAFQRPAQELAANGHQFARGGPGQQAVAGSSLKLVAPSPTAEKPLSSDLVCEQLSERETEVLRLLAEGLSYREIGQRLFISLPTVKTHISHIYGKLGVHNREAALERAGELGLLRVQQHLP